MSADLLTRIERLELALVIEHLSHWNLHRPEIAEHYERACALLKERVGVMLQPYRDSEGNYFNRLEGVSAKPKPAAPVETVPRHGPTDEQLKAVARVLYEGWKKGRMRLRRHIEERNEEESCRRNRVPVPETPLTWEALSLGEVESWMGAAVALYAAYEVKERP